jgi:hypothetical protein
MYLYLLMRPEGFRLEAQGQALNRRWLTRGVMHVHHPFKLRHQWRFRPPCRIEESLSQSGRDEFRSASPQDLG